MEVSYSGIKFVSRDGEFFDTRFIATVDVKTIGGFWLFKKETVETVEIYSKVGEFFRFMDTGEVTPIEIDRLISVHNISCDKKERLEY